MARFRVQYDRYFPSFSYFADLYRLITAKYEKRGNIGHIARDKRAKRSYSYHEKYLLSDTIIQNLSREKTQ